MLVRTLPHARRAPTCPDSICALRSLGPSHMSTPADLSPGDVGALVIHSGPTGILRRWVSTKRIASNAPARCRSWSLPLVCPSQSPPHTVTVLVGHTQRMSMPLQQFRRLDLGCASGAGTADCRLCSLHGACHAGHRRQGEDGCFHSPTPVGLSRPGSRPSP